MPKERESYATVPEVCAYLRISRATLYNWRSLGKGPPARKVGRGLRFFWPDVERWVDDEAA
jgi:excisionase family DNA binding protein